MLNLLMLFMLGFNMQNVTPLPEGQYYEVVKVEYDNTTNQTYGVFVRYNVDNQGHAQKQHLQVRPLEGQKTKEDLKANAPHDSYITMVK